MARIVQLSDLHLRAAGRLLYRQIDTAGALAQAIARINALSPRPDLVVLSGDLANAGSAAEYAHLRAQLAALAVPWALMPGNHDDRAALRAAFPEQPWAAGELAQQRRECDAGDLLLVDTVVPGEDGGAVGEAQLAWLDANLRADRDALLFLHHPPVRTGIAGMDAIGLAGAETLAAWLHRHPRVRALFCGHVHRTIFSEFAGRPLAIAPSPAHQIALDLSGDAAALAWTMEPGGMLLIDWPAGAPPAIHLLPVATAPVHRYAD
ncbi:phosphodiesterase [Azospira restricta]|uniref:Phosphodiesterase n=1 Tax=Azospira restricta TaxID=404405 RepID=A0A974SQB8_9RHOO|nr:phosphodiesterase [Azospira restricta]QRJ64449.1 phosphodiesterase [Azospira restricta]